MSNDGTPQWNQPQGNQAQGQGQPWQQPGQYDQQPGRTPQYGAPAPTGPGGEPPLWAPWYGIAFPTAVGRFFKKYARFDGRASRSEFWWWVLANAIVVIVLYAVLLAVIFATGDTTSSSSATGVQADATSNSPLIAIPVGLLGLWLLATLIPNIAIAVRRLHDANLAGPFWFLSVIPVVGPIVLLVLMLLESKPEGQRFDQPERG
ncbi:MULTISPECIES: DUF805 domain-containing protein [unclassified Curtobacterium]|uniref:DUF805 domain-containing protein n=1 Tax=unclassified Curtobacterium TaxID=257496 RepID=UPI00226B75DB|nr:MULTISPECIES: DUF805 domain-containing protein [unclassified Curtobacterium]